MVSRRPVRTALYTMIGKIFKQGRGIADLHSNRITQVENQRIYKEESDHSSITSKHDDCLNSYDEC